jgi:hypothetical protein
MFGASINENLKQYSDFRLKVESQLHNVASEEYVDNAKRVMTKEMRDFFVTQT